jgi:hypothetical protein
VRAAFFIGREVYFAGNRRRMKFLENA